MKALLALVLVGGCAPSAGGIAAAGYLAQLAKQDCAVEARCGLIGLSEESSCQAAAPDDSALTAEAAGRLAFDSKLAQRCLMLDDARGCSADAHRAYEAECGSVFVGRVAVGGACMESGECAGGGDCEVTASGTAGNCLAALAVGQRCDPEADHCGHSAACDPISMLCAADGAATLGALGDACQVDLFGDTDCALGLYCDDSLTTPSCATPLAAGADCATLFACADSLSCAGLTIDASSGAVTSDGKCSPFADVGGACDASADVSGCPFDMRCEAGACVAGP